MTGPTTPDAVLAWAHDMVEPLAGRAAEAERLRELPPATITDALDAGVFQMVVPRDSGGWGLGLRSLTGCTRILAHGCMSSAWTLSFLILHNWFVARGPRLLSDEVFAARPFALIPCPLAPTGTAVPTDGGYLLSGRWQWATGVQHGDWVMVNSLVDRGGTAESRFCVVPIGDVEIDDVWHTSGMRGTGSNDVVVDGVFVPDALTMPAAELRGDLPPGADRSSDPFVRYPFTPVLTMVAAAPAIGGAEAAVDHFRDHVASRVLPYSMGDRQADQPAAQIRLAEALATVRAARLVWDDAIDRIVEVYDGGRTLPPTERGRFRLAAAHAVRLAASAVAIVIDGAGASVHLAGSPMDRIQRDINTLKGHVVFDWDRAAQLAGKLELGAAPGPTDML